MSKLQRYLSGGINPRGKTLPMRFSPKECGECRREAEVFYTDVNGGEIARCYRCDDHEKGQLCSDEDCQQCCDHRDREHGVCIYCHLDLTEDEAVKAFERAKDLKKYGE